MGSMGSLLNKAWKMLEKAQNPSKNPPEPCKIIVEMTQPSLPLVQTPPQRRRGRPPGARNKRSADLGRYVEAMFGGMTPGQQAAELALIKPAEIKRAKADARELGVVDLDLPPLMLAMVVKATRLANALGIEKADAWVLLQKERADLMPYIHQRQAQAPDGSKKPPAPPTVFLVPEGEAQAQLADLTPDDDDAIELIEHSSGGADDVSPDKSHDDA